MTMKLCVICSNILCSYIIIRYQRGGSATRRGGGAMGERGNDLRLVRILQGRGCGVKKRRLETYADVVQKQKETPPPEPSQDKPRVLTTLMKDLIERSNTSFQGNRKVKAIRRKVARRTSLCNMAEDYALSDSCEAAIYEQACLKRLPYTQCLLENVNA